VGPVCVKTARSKPDQEILHDANLASGDEGQGFKAVFANNRSAQGINHIQYLFLPVPVRVGLCPSSNGQILPISPTYHCRYFPLQISKCLCGVSDDFQLINLVMSFTRHTLFWVSFKNLASRKFLLQKLHVIPCRQTTEWSINPLKNDRNRPLGGSHGLEGTRPSSIRRRLGPYR
jgi:hypothetical protein